MGRRFLSAAIAICVLSIVAPAGQAAASPTTVEFHYPIARYASDIAAATKAVDNLVSIINTNSANEYVAWRVNSKNVATSCPKGVDCTKPAAISV
jgi:hypothetical protein